MKPLKDKVAIIRYKTKTQTAGGIIIPDSAQPPSLIGIVIAVGEGKVNNKGILIPPEVKVGDKVVISRYGSTGYTITEDERELLVIPESEILAVLEDE